MRFCTRIGNSVIVAVIVAVVAQAAGCGTLLYPERRGQTHGRIDAGVAILDGIGLLFFIIPGMIAYAIDFSTGAIYLSGGHRSSLSPDGVKVIRVDPRSLDDRTISEIVSRETGIPVDSTKAERYVLKDPAEIPAKIAEAKIRIPERHG